MTQSQATDTRHPYPDRLHDLPPAWDGVPVTWRPWQTGRSTLVFHVRNAELACRACGLLDEDLTAVGIIDLDIPRNGWRPRLHAHRCRGCGRDQVHDLDTDEMWDLDATDYGDAGSVPPPEQGTLFDLTD